MLMPGPTLMPGPMLIPGPWRMMGFFLKPAVSAPIPAVSAPMFSDDSGVAPAWASDGEVFSCEGFSSANVSSGRASQEAASQEAVSAVGRTGSAATCSVPNCAAPDCCWPDTSAGSTIIAVREKRESLIIVCRVALLIVRRQCGASPKWLTRRVLKR